MEICPACGHNIRFLNPFTKICTHAGSDGKQRCGCDHYCVKAEDVAAN